MANKSQIVLVLPPFADAANPALGPSLLTAGCRQRGLTATLLYANLDFAAEVGFDLYQAVALSASTAFLGETIFQSSAFPSSDADALPTAAIDHIFGPKDSLETNIRHGGTLTKDAILSCHARATGFLDQVIHAILAHEPQIVGFSSVFEQNMASIALARRIKAAAPEIVTVLGGGNADDPMGAALADLVPEFDFVFSGESDFAFPEFCERYLEDGDLPDQRVVQCEPIDDMDATFVPEYDEYYAQLAPLVQTGSLPEALPEWVHFETSRGCWYGAKSHCKFCGLKDLDLGYRAKSPERALQEITHLARRYGARSMAAVDNIMPHGVHREVLPELTEAGVDVRFFYEVKANLREEDLDLFVLSGIVSVQPGIESFSSNALKQIGKGVSGVQNIWLLRECSSRQIVLLWNLLTGIPGETQQDYEATLELLPHVEHLAPPNGWGTIRLDRYSPYFVRPEAHGITNLRPNEVYDNLYPPDARLNDIAYHFHGDYSTDFLDDADLVARLDVALEKWAAAWREAVSPPRLVAMHLGKEQTLVEDTRACALETFFGLHGSLATLLRQLGRPVARHAIAEEDRAALEVLLRRHFVVEHEGRYVSVVTNPGKGVALREQRQQTIQTVGLSIPFAQEEEHAGERLAEPGPAGT